MTLSPYVQRQLDAQRAVGRAAKRYAEPTLGDAVRADLSITLTDEPGDFSPAWYAAAEEAVAADIRSALCPGCEVCDPVEALVWKAQDDAFYAEDLAAERAASLAEFDEDNDLAEEFSFEGDPAFNGAFASW